MSTGTSSPCSRQPPSSNGSSSFATCERRTIDRPADRHPRPKTTPGHRQHRRSLPGGKGLMLGFLANMSISRKLWLSFAALIALMLLMAGVAQIFQNRVTEAALDALDHDAKVSDDADRA